MLTAPPTIAQTSMTRELATRFDYAGAVKVAVPQCPVCVVPNDSWGAIDRYGYAIGVSACRCGLAYLNPRMTAEAYQGFYSGTYRPLIFGMYGVAGSETQDQCHERGRMVGALLRYGGARGGHLLDVGGGTGRLAAGLLEVLPVTTVTVLDPNTTELQEANARGYQTMAGLIEMQPAPVRQYDLICCALTADHWLEPLHALRWLRSALAPQGRLYVDMVDAGEWRKLQPLNYFKIDHPLYWVPQSFRLALAQTGWHVVASALTGNHRVRHHDKRRRSYICRGA